MKRSAKAMEKLYRADRYRRSDGLGGTLLADTLEADAKTLLTPVSPVTISAGEILPQPDESSIMDGDAFSAAELIRNTLVDPDAIAVEASEARTSRAAQAGVLEMALDAAQSIQARNSLEKMLAHGIAAAHDSALRLLTRAFDPRNPPVETARLANSAARLIQIFQEGLLTLHKIRAGGRQLVTVQHVTISPGGQAVVAGNIDRGTYKSGDGEENHG